MEEKEREHDELEAEQSGQPQDVGSVPLLELEAILKKKEEEDGKDELCPQWCKY